MSLLVIPAQAGIQVGGGAGARWIPAFESVDKRETGRAPQSPGNEFPGSVAPSRLKADCKLRVLESPFQGTFPRLSPGIHSRGAAAAHDTTPFARNSAASFAGMTTGNRSNCRA